MNYSFVLIVTLVAMTCEAAKKEEDIKSNDIREAEERQDFLARITLECSEETNLELEAAKTLLLGDLNIQTNEAKCFVRCIFKKEGFLSEHDVPQIDFIVETLAISVKLQRSALKKIIKKCSKFDNEDPCDSAFKLLECYSQNQAIVKNIEL